MKTLVGFLLVIFIALYTISIIHGMECSDMGYNDSEQVRCVKYKMLNPLGAEYRP